MENKEKKHEEKEIKNIKNATNNEKGQKNSKREKELEQEVETLRKQISGLETKIVSLEFENQKNINDFKVSASAFEKKAQEKLNEFKNSLSQKLEEDKAEIKKYGSQKLLESIIEPLLNIKLAVKVGAAQEGAVQNYVRGFEMLLAQLDSEFESFGIVVINPQVGEEFNPSLHYAISTKEGSEHNKIAEVKKVGYKLHDRVIKPATVVIGK